METAIPQKYECHKEKMNFAYRKLFRSLKKIEGFVRVLQSHPFTMKLLKLLLRQSADSNVICENRNKITEQIRGRQDGIILAG